MLGAVTFFDFLARGFAGVRGFLAGVGIAEDMLPFGGDGASRADVPMVIRCVSSEIKAGLAKDGGWWIRGGSWGWRNPHAKKQRQGKKKLRYSVRNNQDGL